VDWKCLDCADGRPSFLREFQKCNCHHQADSPRFRMRLHLDHTLLFGRLPAAPAVFAQGLFFKNEADFQRFYQECRVGPAVFAMGAGSVPLLAETDAALRRTKRVAQAYQETALQPCHFFVAATEVPTSIFRSLLTTNNMAPEAALAYYVRNGQLPAAPVPANTSRQQLGKLWRAIFSCRR